jgi:hypothetical protein
MSRKPIKFHFPGHERIIVTERRAREPDPLPEAPQGYVSKFVFKNLDQAYTTVAEQRVREPDLKPEVKLESEPIRQQADDPAPVLILDKVPMNGTTNHRLQTRLMGVAQNGKNVMIPLSLLNKIEDYLIKLNLPEGHELRCEHCDILWAISVKKQKLA